MNFINIYYPNITGYYRILHDITEYYMILLDITGTVSGGCKCGIKKTSGIVGGSETGVFTGLKKCLIYFSTRSMNTHGSQSLEIQMATFRGAVPPPWSDYSMFFVFDILTLPNVFHQIASNWALTASHCFYKGGETQVQFAADTTVVLGVHDRTVTTDLLR